MGRRKKKSQNDDSFDEEMAIEIYRKRKSFEKPENTGLETVFESEGKDKDEKNENEPVNGKKARAQRATKPKQGLQPKLRMINTQPYYLEDEDKTVHRKKQITKLFKGRKKFKWKGLTAKQEEKLFLTISEKTDTDIDTEEEEGEDEENVVDQAGTTPFIINDSTPSLRKLSSSLLKSEQQIDESSSFHTPLSSFSSSENIGPLEIDVNTIKEADDFLGPLGFSDDEDTGTIQSTFKKLKVAKAEKENVVRDNDRRKSKITKVRRSSRLFRGQNQPPTDESSNLGTVYHDMEVETKTSNRNSRRRSSRPKVQDLVMSSPQEPSPSEEAMRLYVETND